MSILSDIVQHIKHAQNPNHLVHAQNWQRVMLLKTQKKQSEVSHSTHHRTPLDHQSTQGSFVVV